MAEEELISLVREYPFLYNISDKRYKNKILKENKWNEIGKIIGCPVEKAKGRWKSLRDRYRREIKNNKLPSGSGAFSRCQWKYMEMLEFLSDSIHQRPTSSNFSDIIEYEHGFDQNVQENTENIQPALFPDETSMDTLEPINIDVEVLASSSNSNRSTKKALKGPREKILQDMTDNFNNFLENASGKLLGNAKDSPAQQFFRSIANEVDKANLKKRKVNQNRT